MSNATTERTGNGPSRRRSRGGRNRNRNRNNQQGRQGGENRSGSGQHGRRSREPRRPQPVKLTWWQKLLKAIGLYKEPSRDAKRGPKTATRDTRSAAAREPRQPRPETERRTPETSDVDSNRIYLGNLSYEVTESDLEELFKGVGSVRSVEIVYNRRTHRSKGYGFVDMMGTDEAKRAVEVLHDQFFMGRKLVVSGAKSKGPIDDQDDDVDGEENTPAS